MRRERGAADEYGATIDWDRYWEEADEDARDEASPAAHHAADVLAAFVEETGADAVADVGCGAGAAAFAVAERHPETAVVGYDAAGPVLESNRERAHESGLENLRFERAVLPRFDPDREFDVVFCYFTLQYVRDVERALRNLRDAVVPGGHLVFNYFNEGAREYCLEAADDPIEHADRALVFDPERYTERFEAVLDGESVLSPERIEAALDTEPRSVFSVVDRPDIRWAWHHFPLVYVSN